MSRIARISLATHVNELGGKLWNPAIRWTRKHAVFVIVEDDMGHTGLGECWCFDTAPDALLAFLRTEVLPQFQGTDLSEAESVARRLMDRATLTARHGILCSALSGIDIAVWDLRSRQRATPLWRQLNPTGRGTAALYASGGLYGRDKSRDDLCREMAGMTAQGFGLCKMKIGGLKVAEDIARVEAVLATLPAQAKLIIDGVYSYTSSDAQRIYEALPEGRIEAFQSPTKAWDIAGMAELSGAGVPVMATEAEYRHEMHRLLIDRARVAFLQTAPIASGGITGARGLAELCTGTDTRLSLEVSSTGVALMAACHIAAAESLVAHVEYHTVHQVFFTAFGLDPHRFNPDEFAPPDLPGLGISLPDTEVSTANNPNAHAAFEDPKKRTTVHNSTYGETDDKPYL